MMEAPRKKTGGEIGDKVPVKLCLGPITEVPVVLCSGPIAKEKVPHILRKE